MGFEASVVTASLNHGVNDLNWIMDQRLSVSSDAQRYAGSFMSTIGAMPDADQASSFLQRNCAAIGLSWETIQDTEIGRRKSLAKRRACKKKTFTAPTPSNHVFLSYISTAISLYPSKDWEVWDFGIAADNSINACFWLSIVAGLSRRRERYATDDNAVLAFYRDLEGLKSEPLQDMTKEIRPLAGDDLLGKLARRLRNLVRGEAGHMLQKNNIHKYAPAFAYLQQEYKCSASFADYVHWVHRVAECEYADELVLSATAEMLQLDLVVAPYTPVSSDSPWSVWNSQSLLHSARDAPRILLGDDDVHYVLLF